MIKVTRVWQPCHSKKKRKEEQIASVHNEGYAKMPLYTPATKKRKVLSKIVKAKEFDERGLDTAALEYYKIGTDA